jgi:hypothetical protein
MGELKKLWCRSSWVLLLLPALVGLVACGGNGALRSPESRRSETTIGALLSLTGPGNSLGIASKAALEIASNEINAGLAKQGSDTSQAISEKSMGTASSSSSAPALTWISGRDCSPPDNAFTAVGGGS